MDLIADRMHMQYLSFYRSVISIVSGQIFYLYFSWDSPNGHLSTLIFFIFVVQIQYDYDGTMHTVFQFQLFLEK